MDIGMLWFDNDPKTDLLSKLARASSYYQKKYGKAPNLCFVHPSMYIQFSSKPSGMEIQENPAIRPHHFWLGSQG
jgi:hypothetical protein